MANDAARAAAAGADPERAAGPDVVSIVADPDTAALFGAFGLAPLPAEGAEEARRQVTAAIEAGAGFLVLTEETYAAAHDVLAATDETPYGVLPDPTGREGLSRKSLLEAARRATGSDRIVEALRSEVGS